jgi:phosphatidate cytidylyltransferase
MTRLASALFLISVIVVTIWWLPPWATLALTSLVALLAGGELAHLGTKVGADVPAGFLAVLVVVVTLAFALDNSTAAPGGALLIVVLLTAVVAVGAVTLAGGPADAAAVTRAGLTALGPLYVGVPLGALAAVQAVEGPAVLTLLLVIVAVSDSAQFFTGRMLGKRKLAPGVSPGKTVEGAIGGLAAALVVGALVAPRLLPPAVSITVTTGAALGLGLAAVGLLGDLFESLLKRGAGVKDSSALIPGHGGVLDRIDSYLFAAPAYFVYLRFIG